MAKLNTQCAITIVKCNFKNVMRVLAELIAGFLNNEYYK